MLKTIVTSFIALFLAISCAQVKQVPRKQLASAIPVLHITNDTNATALKISSLSIDVKVAANIATTIFDIIFYNPNDRVLEGEFEFPLADGQNIVQYALDIDGKLREGVVVEKAKARVAFENTIRRKIDPGLVEKTRGNNFRTRIYPLPAKGTRHILIAVEQSLELLNKDLFFQLPLYTTEPIDKFSIKTAVIKSSKKPELEENGFANFKFSKWENTWLAEHKEDNFRANQTIAFTIPNSSGNENLVLAENYNGLTYFYTHIPVEPDYKKKETPGTIGMLWDVSASGEKRDIEKEKELLKEYLSQLSEVKVSLIPFNVFIQGQENFTITAGNCDALLNRIKKLAYDGGTQFGAIDLTKYNFDEILLFSDGLSTFGKKEMILSSTPVITINTSPSADFSYLKFIAQQTHGKFIDLSKLEMPAAVTEIKNQSLQVVNIEFNPAEIEELVAQITPIQNSGFSFAGKLKTASAVVKVDLGFGNEVKTVKTFTIARPDSSEYNQVKRIWAAMNIAQLDLQFEKNKETITKLGKNFSIVTQNTSLIVLDRVEDYVEHEITPPEELQKEYFTLLKEKQKEDKNKKTTAFNDALDAMKELKEWWHKNYSPVKNKKPEELIPTASEGGYVDSIIAGRISVSADQNAISDSRITDSTGRMTQNLTPGLASNSKYAATDSTGRVAVEYYSITLDSLSYFADSAVHFYSTSGELLVLGSVVKKPEEEKSAIELNDWKPDVAYLKELEKASAANRVSKYFELKKKYFGQPSFFIDVARFFIEKGDKKFGIQVLSNIAEMKLESAELMRMLANQLLEANEKELAIETFKDVMKIREEDPQSYRDLALAYNETGKYNEAVELLYKLITGTWDERFGDIKAIAINEMNAIISSHKEAVNTTAVDSRLIHAMPVDVRIVIGWSSDNSDIDLWVTDPRNEKCDYSHSETEIGGKMSEDVTQGFGPEEFCLRRAWKGKYKVEVNLFGDSGQTIGGPIAIKADLYTDFGRPSQKKQTINFRVKTNKEVIELGVLKFGS